MPYRCGIRTYSKYLVRPTHFDRCLEYTPAHPPVMLLAVMLGVTLAVMRLSPDPVLRSVSWVYIWIFRGTPVYVQLVFWGLLPVMYKNI